MKQKQHSTEEIIRILRQAGGDDTVDAFVENTTSPMPPCIVGAASMVIWTWPMPNGSKRWRKKMRN